MAGAVVRLAIQLPLSGRHWNMFCVTTGPDTGGVGASTPDGEPALSVAAVARRLGVAPATLRTWARRYGVGPSGHTTGRHRRYGPADLARLELMQRALLRGATPAEAAHYALTKTLDQHPTQHQTQTYWSDGPAGPAGTVRDSAADDPVRGTDHIELVDSAAAAWPLSAESGCESRSRRVGGGWVLRLPGVNRRARGLGRAALAMDSTGAQAVLAEAIDGCGTLAAWNEVIRPVMAAVVARWEHSGAGVEVEHLLRECVLAALLRATPPVTAPRNPRPVLLAGAPTERHSLPLYALAAVLAERDIGVRMLGAALPADALVSAIRRSAPAGVVVWAQLPRDADPAVLRSLPRTRQRTRLFLGGPGWRLLGDIDPHLGLPDALGDAADEIERVLLGPRTGS